MTDVRHDLTRTVLAVVCIAGLVGATFWVLRPFLGAAIWAANSWANPILSFGR